VTTPFSSNVYTRLEDDPWSTRSMPGHAIVSHPVPASKQASTKSHVPTMSPPHASNLHSPLPPKPSVSPVSSGRRSVEPPSSPPLPPMGPSSPPAHARIQLMAFIRPSPHESTVDSGDEG